MKHTALGESYAHTPQEVIQLLIQEAGCEPSEVFAEGLKQLGTAQRNQWCARIVDQDAYEVVLFVEAGTEEEVLQILKDAGVRYEGVRENDSGCENWG